VAAALIVAQPQRSRPASAVPAALAATAASPPAAGIDAAFALALEDAAPALVDGAVAAALATRLLQLAGDVGGRLCAQGFPRGAVVLELFANLRYQVGAVGGCAYVW
jgi:hypothetical protein